MLQSSKLSYRFKNLSQKQDLMAEPVIADETVAVIENSDEDFEFFLKKSLLEKIETIPVWFEYSLEKQKELITGFINNKLLAANKSISDEEKILLINNLSSAVSGFGPIDYLIKQDNVSAVFINGLNPVHIEIAGKVLNTEMKLDSAQIKFILKNIENSSENKPDKNSCLWNCRYSNLMISVIFPPVSSNGVNIIIKKIRKFDLKTLAENTFLTGEIFEFIVNALNSKKNIIISGDINSGKTVLIDTIINSSLQNKRGMLVEEFPQIICEFESVSKFNISELKSDYEFKVLYSNLLKIQTDYFVIDSNNPYVFNSSVTGLSKNQGALISLRSSSIENTISKFINAFVSEEKCSEKLAKMKFFTDFDYIVQINRCPDGVKRITSVIELNPAKTLALCTRIIAKWEINHYITDIPQPLTSIKADSLIAAAKNGSMKERFYS